MGIWEKQDKISTVKLLSVRVHLGSQCEKAGGDDGTIFFSCNKSQPTKINTDHIFGMYKELYLS